MSSSTVQLAAIGDACRLLARVAHADIVLVVDLTPGPSWRIVASVGCHVENFDTYPGLKDRSLIGGEVILFEDLASTTWFQTHALSRVAPHANRLAALPISVSGGLTTHCVYIIDPDMAILDGSQAIANVSDISRLIATLIPETETPTVTAAIPGMNEAPPSIKYHPIGATDPVFSFLDSTLVRSTRLNSRKQVAFVTFRRWKSSIKDSQIVAMHSLKAGGTDEIVSLIAHEICAGVVSIYGGAIFSAVVPIPGGSSGSESAFSVRLGQAVARELGVAFANCLVPQGNKGKSHPTKSRHLKQYQVREVPSGTVLLIDDVVSTGTHMEMGVSALRSAGLNVFAVGWIGGSAPG